MTERWFARAVPSSRRNGDADNILKAQESLNTAHQDNYRLTESPAGDFEPQTFEEQQQAQTASVSEAQCTQIGQQQ